MGKVFVFHIKGEKRKAIRAFTEELGHEFKFVPRMDYGKSIGQIVGLPDAAIGKPMYDGPDIEDELILFSDFSSEELELYLDTFKEKELERVALKAMVTPTNAYWDVTKLYQEMDKEKKNTK